MSVIALPTDLHISRMSWGQRRNDTEFRSTFGAQALESAVPLWAASITVDKMSESNSGTWKTILMQLKGRINQLALYDIARPAPRGTMRGAMTLASAEAQGSTSIDIVTTYGTNLLTFPDALDNAVWTKTNSSVTANALAAPDGTTTAELLKEDTANTTHLVFEVVSGLTSGAQYTWSFFAKAGTRSMVKVVLSQGANAVNATVNLTNGAYFSAVAITGGVWTGATSSITALPNGWYRISVTANIVGSTALSCQAQLHNGTTVTYLGDGASGLYVWGGKLELGTLTDYGYGLTLLKGDLLGLGSGLTQQVVMVLADATSTGQGNITVTTEPPLRNAFALAAAVTWDKPAALFRSQSSLAGWDYEQTFASGFKLDLLEDWRA